MKKLRLVIALIILALIFGCAAQRSKSSQRNCKYTYISGGQEHSITTCLPACPVHPAWKDIGPCPN